MGKFHNISKRKDSFTVVWVEQWTKFKCHSYCRLAENKIMLRFAILQCMVIDRSRVQKLQHMADKG
jgi:hypothetical protein